MGLTGDLRLTDAVTTELLRLDDFCELRCEAAQAFPLPSGLGPSSAGPFPQDLAFKLSKHPSHAMARPMGVVRSSAWLSDTNPTPRWRSSCSVATKSATDRRQRSRRRAACSSCLPQLTLRSSGANLAYLHNSLQPRRRLASSGFRLHWTWNVGHRQPGRPVTSREVRDLILDMCRRSRRLRVNDAKAKMFLKRIKIVISVKQRVLPI